MGSHWYSKEGNLHTKVPYAKSNKLKAGQFKDASLTDARKNFWFPSVTGITSIMSKPGLDIYKQTQVLMTALTSTQGSSETDEDFCKRVIRESKAEAELAADEGQRIHRAISKVITSGGGATIDSRYRKHVEGVLRTLKDVGINVSDCFSELPVVNLGTKYGGYGGTIDLVCKWLKFVIDFKTKEFDEDINVNKMVYPENIEQLAAYGGAVLAPAVKLDSIQFINVFISRNKPGLVKTRGYTPTEINRAWEGFQLTKAKWFHKNNYNPFDRVPF